MHSAHTQRHPGGTFLGFPLEGFSLFQSLLLSLASAFFAFFLTTTLAIFALLAWNLFGHHTVNYANSYLYAGLPVAVVTLLVALPLFATLWIRAKLRN
jgi:FtsH-binding integral membrane protein